MLLTAEPLGTMEKSERGAAGSASVSPGRPPRAGKAPRREKEHSPSSRGRRPRASKTVRLPETSGKKEKAKRERAEVEEEVKVEEERDGAVKSTVVDVDSVREKEGREDNEESMGLLESEWQEDGKSWP